jgi:23S rRNA (uracil1939-C5)-methyltransferase
MVESGTNLEVEVDKLVYGGEGLSRVDGQVTLTRFVLPGERAQVVVEERKPGLLRTRLVELRTAAPQRVEPGCPYFGRCGGCHYQHADYETQLAAKRAILVEVLARVGKITAPERIETISAEPWQYRNRSQFHIRGSELGYLEGGSHRLCAIERCPISSPKLNDVIGALREMLRDARWPSFLHSVEAFTNEQDVQINIRVSDRPVAQRFFDWCAERIPGYTPAALEYPAAGFLYRVGPRSFFQVNRHLADALVRAALEGLQGDDALDLYAGVGLFSLPMASRFREVTSVESGSGAVRDLIFNLARAGLPVRVEQNTAETYLNELDRAPACVLLDPPRAGLGKNVARRLVELRPPEIVIVACDPATLARDLRILLDGGYGLERMTLVDLFPQTFHLETVAVLRHDLCRNGPA